MKLNRYSYYVGVPLVTFGLCAFSYYLGYQRGAQPEQQKGDSPTIAKKPLHDTSEDLTFFKVLKEKPVKKSVKKSDKKKKVSKVSKVKKVTASKKSDPSKVLFKLSIQVSAFKDIGKAHELIDALKNKGYPAYTETKLSSGFEWHRVFVGPYPTRVQADRVATKLSNNGFKGGFVTRVIGG